MINHIRINDQSYFVLLIIVDSISDFFFVTELIFLIAFFCGQNNFLVGFLIVIYHGNKQ
jgi:hypothetical protein